MRHLWATTCLVAVGLALAAPAGAASPPQGVTWGGRHFTDPTTFSAWLSHRGVRYRGWAARHPRGVYLMTHPAPKPAPKSKPKPRATRHGVGTAVKTTVIRPASATGGSRRALLLLALFLIGFGAVAPATLRAARVRADAATLDSTRYMLIGAGAVVLVALVLAGSL